MKGLLITATLVLAALTPTGVVGYRCNSLKSCENCTYGIGSRGDGPCGWCPATETCMQSHHYEDPVPLPPSTCASGFSVHHQVCHSKVHYCDKRAGGCGGAGDVCSECTPCKDCGFCWYKPNRWIITGTCVPGNSAGPTNTSLSCPQGWSYGNSDTCRDGASRRLSGKKP